MCTHQLSPIKMFKLHLLLGLLCAAPAVYNWNNSKEQVKQDTVQLTSLVKLTSFLEHGTGRRIALKKYGRLSLLYISIVLLLNSSDVEANPGPSRVTEETKNSQNITFYPCGTCKEEVNWDHKGLLCETCYTWYHINCQDVHDNTYARLGATDVSWHCLMCEAPNYSSVVLDLHGLESTNRFAPLDDSSFCSIDSIDSGDVRIPLHTSSPVKPKPKPVCARRPLRIINMNCQSLVNKKAPFLNLVDSTKPDVIIATETWFHNDIKDAEYFSANYTVHRRDRITTTTGGGLIIAVNSEFISSKEEVLETSDTELMWVKLNVVGSKSLYVGACYRPKMDDMETLDAIDESLQRIGSDKNVILLGGDFNLPGWDWKSNQVRPKSPYPGAHHRFGEVLNDHGLSQIIQEPTRENNILDLIATNRPNQINRTQIIPGISDHNIPYTELDINPSRSKQIPRNIPLYSKANWDGLRHHLKGIADEIREAELTSSTEALWQSLKEGILSGIETFIPHKRTKSKDSCPWIDHKLKTLLRRKNRA